MLCGARYGRFNEKHTRSLHPEQPPNAHIAECRIVPMRSQGNKKFAIPDRARLSRQIRQSAIHLSVPYKKTLSYVVYPFLHEFQSTSEFHRE